MTSHTDREAAEDIGRFYFGEDTDISSLPSEDGTIRQLTRMFSMSYFFSAAHQDSRLLAQAGADVHAFVLAHPPAFTLMDLFRLSLGQLCWMFTARSFGYNPYPHQYGVCHGDDINYLFPMEPPGFPPAVVTEEQLQVQSHLLDIVSSYAADGETRNIRDVGGVWQPLQVSQSQRRRLTLSYLIISL